MEPNEKFDLIQKLLREVNELQLTVEAQIGEQPPINEMAFVFLTGYRAGIEDVMNVLRKEL